MAHTHNIGTHTQLSDSDSDSDPDSDSDSDSLSLSRTQNIVTNTSFTHRTFTHNSFKHKKLSYPSLSHKSVTHTHNIATNNAVTHTQLFHTQHCHPHTQLCHTPLFHTQLFHTQNCHPQLCHTHTRTALSHNQCSTVSFLFPAFPIWFSHLFGVYWKKLTCGWGYLVLYFFFGCRQFSSFLHIASKWRVQESQSACCMEKTCLGRSFYMASAIFGEISKGVECHPVGKVLQRNVCLWGKLSHVISFWRCVKEWKTIAIMWFEMILRVVAKTPLLHTSAW